MARTSVLMLDSTISESLANRKEQTARISTGGKPPRKKLESRAPTAAEPAVLQLQTIGTDTDTEELENINEPLAKKRRIGNKGAEKTANTTLEDEDDEEATQMNLKNEYGPTPSRNNDDQRAGNAPINRAESTASRLCVVLRDVVDFEVEYTALEAVQTEMEKDLMALLMQTRVFALLAGRVKVKGKDVEQAWATLGGVHKQISANG